MFISQAELTCFITFSSVINISCIDSIASEKHSSKKKGFRAGKRFKTIFCNHNNCTDLYISLRLYKLYAWLLLSIIHDFNSLSLLFLLFFFSPSPLVYLVLCVLILDLLLTRIYLIVDYISVVNLITVYVNIHRN